MNRFGKSKADVDLKWTELYSFLDAKGIDSPLRYLNDLINKTYTAYTFNNSTYDNQYQILCELAKIMEKEFNKQASRFSKEAWTNQKGPNSSLIKVADDAREELRERFGDNIPEKIVKIILKQHGLDLFDLQKDIKYDGSGSYNVDDLMNWLGY